MNEHVVTFEEVIKVTRKRTVTLKLYPCPFCGASAKFSEAWSGRVCYGVVCTGCKARTPIRGGNDGKLRAAELWNRRTSA